MQYDIFFSISQTPVNGELPIEATMFGNFFEQVEHALHCLWHESGMFAEALLA